MKRDEDSERPGVRGETGLSATRHGLEGLHGCPCRAARPHAGSEGAAWAGTAVNVRSRSLPGERGSRSAPLSEQQGAAGPSTASSPHGGGCRGRGVPGRGCSHTPGPREAAKPPRPDPRQPPAKALSEPPGGGGSPGPGSPRDISESRSRRPGAGRARAADPLRLPGPAPTGEPRAGAAAPGSGGSAPAQAGRAQPPAPATGPGRRSSPLSPSPLSSHPPPAPRAPAAGSVPAPARLAALSHRPALTSRPGPLRRRPRSHRPRAGPAPPRPARLWAAGPGRAGPTLRAGNGARGRPAGPRLRVGSCIAGIGAARHGAIPPAAPPPRGLFYNKAIPQEWFSSTRKALKGYFPPKLKGSQLTGSCTPKRGT